MTKPKAVLMIEQRTNKVVSRYDSIMDAALANDYDRASISRKCKLIYPKCSDKYIFRFEDDYLKNNIIDEENNG